MVLSNIAVLTAVLAVQQSPSEAGLRLDEPAIAVIVTLQDPASVAQQIQLTPGGLTTTSYFFLRSQGFSILDTGDAWVEATVRIAPTGHRYKTRDGIGIGTTGIAYTVRVRFCRRVFVVSPGRIDATDAYVWEAERFGVGSADDSGRGQIHDDLNQCLALFAASFHSANRPAEP